MKNFLSKLPLICFIAVLCGVIFGCEPIPTPEPEPDPVEPTDTTATDTTAIAFSVAVKNVADRFVEIEFTCSDSLEVAYLLDTKDEEKSKPQNIFMTGEEIKVGNGQIVKIEDGVDQDTQYYLYVVAKLDASNYSEIFKLDFRTKPYEFKELVTIIDRALDGYRVRLTIPEETKARKNAIRWSQADLMTYNFFNADDFSSLLHNGGSVENAAVKDTTIVYSEDVNWYETGEDYDGDGQIDLDFRYTPISPGEPVVFIAGEFSWMEDDPSYETEYFQFPSGWDPGYYMPLVDPAFFTAGGNKQNSVGIIDDLDLSRPLDDYWTGAFQRKLLRVQEPEPFDGKVDVSLIEASPINISLAFIPDDNVYQYAVGVFDDAIYHQLLDLCSGREEYLQWAITSYFAAYNFGTQVRQGAVQMDLTNFYFQDAISEDTDYHVLVTAMEDNMATKQSFQKYTFHTTVRTMEAPVVEVTPVQSETEAYTAVFNVKCTTAAEGNPVTQCYYAANYLRDWLLAINSGSTYFSIVAGNKAYSYFTADEIEKINSPEGYNIAIASLDGETTRIAVLGYNEEYTPNDLLSFPNIEDCPAVADCTTPFTDPKPYVNPTLYTDLADEWTATATLRSAKDAKDFTHTSKITLATDLYDYPASLTQDVYDLYETAKYDKEKVDALWREFKSLAQQITEERLENQNRLVATGWLDKDSYDRLTARTPYDLFVATDYNSVDVSSLFNDFGPKWYLETSVDSKGNVSYSIPFDMYFLPPAANWSATFYLGAMEPENYVAFLYSEERDPNKLPAFPVTVSADRNTITIEAFEYGGVKYYPQMIGFDSSTQGTILENPVVSEIVLTRGWTDSNKRQSSVSYGAAKNVPVKAEFPPYTYKQRTEISGPVYDKVEGAIMTMEQFKVNTDKYTKRMFKQNN